MKRAKSSDSPEEADEGAVMCTVDAGVSALAAERKKQRECGGTVRSRFARSMLSWYKVNNVYLRFSGLARRHVCRKREGYLCRT
jgi:hypothetical protein